MIGRADGDHLQVHGAGHVRRRLRLWGLVRARRDARAHGRGPLPLPPAARARRAHLFSRGVHAPRRREEERLDRAAGHLLHLRRVVDHQAHRLHAPAEDDRREFGREPVDPRAGKESEIPNFKGSDLGRFPLVRLIFGRAIIPRNGLEA